MKKAVISFIAGIGLTFAGVAQAQPVSNLTIVNNTSWDSTTIIHTSMGPVCSQKLLGENGVTRARSTKVIPEGTLKFACAGHLDNCRAEIYMRENCTGPKIADAVFSFTGGVKSIVMAPSNPGFTIVNRGFTIIASGGPSK